jgi:hypothetical protein
MGLAQTRDRDDGTMKGLCMGSGHGSIAIIVDSALGNSSFRGLFYFEYVLLKAWRQLL